MSTKNPNQKNIEGEEVEESVTKTNEEKEVDALDAELDSMSLENIPSVSSSILDQVHIGGENMQQGEGNQEKGRQHRLSEAQLRRFNWYLGQGYLPEAALDLARFSIEASGQQKRIRSVDQSSPNVSGQSGPLKKRARSNQRPAAGITFQEMVEAVPIAIISKDYPETRLSREQLMATKEALLERIGNLVDPDVRPNFRRCEFKQGYLQLACGDVDTASWLKETAVTLTPGGAVALKAIEVAELPKLSVFMGYFSDSCNTKTERVLQLVQNQNKDLCTKSWRVIYRNVIAKTVELTLEVDEKSANHIEANKFHLNYMFGKARLRKVTGGSSVAKRGKSAVQPLNNNAKAGKAVPKGHQGRKQHPPAKARSGQQKAQKTQQPNRPASSTTAAPRKVLLKANLGQKLQPLDSSITQTPPNGDRREPATRGSRALDGINEEIMSPNNGDEAAGTRQPTPEPSGNWAEDGAPSQQ